MKTAKLTSTNQAVDTDGNTYWIDERSLINRGIQTLAIGAEVLIMSTVTDHGCSFIIRCVRYL